MSVPPDYATIQAAIDAAADCDTVLVDSGVYVEVVDFLGKSITVRSVHGPETTTIDGNQLGSVVTFPSDEGRDSVLEGFTITYGIGNLFASQRWGGGVFCKYSSPTIRGNLIIDNAAEPGDGVGLWGLSAPPVGLTLRPPRGGR